jgi:hypothetical protein
MWSLDSGGRQPSPITGGHFAVFMHSDQFLQELVNRVRPLAAGH